MLDWGLLMPMPAHNQSPAVRGNLRYRCMAGLFSISFFGAVFSVCMVCALGRGMCVMRANVKVNGC